MQVWFLLIGAIALASAVVALWITLRRAERRARRLLFSNLGLNEETIALLMTRNGDVLTELTLARRQEAAASAHPTAQIHIHPRRGTTASPSPNIRLVSPVDQSSEDADTPSSPSDDRSRP
jgi:hypothetical protein